MSVRYVLPALLSVVIGVLMVSESYGQTVEDWRATEEKIDITETVPEGEYNGVTPGSGNTLPRIEALKGKKGSFVTWPGFLIQDSGGSRFFVQSTGVLEYRLAADKKTITIQISNTKVFLRNNQNPLVTTHFNTPVKRAYIKKRGKHVELVLELKTEATPEIGQIVSEDGYHYMFIDFPPGTYPVPSDNPEGDDKAL